MKRIFPFFSNVLWQRERKYFRSYGIAILIFFIGLLLSFATFRFYSVENLNHTHAEFDRIANLRLLLVKDILLGTLQQIDQVKSFFYSSSEVTEKNFHSFVHHIFKLYPNFLFLGWIETNPSSDSSQGLNFVNLDSKEMTNQNFIPFTYLEKFRSPLFIDSADYQVFLNLLKSSQRSLEVKISDKIIYFQQEKKTGFFLFESIFSDNMEPSSKTKLIGTIVGFSNFQEIRKNTKNLIEPIEIHLSIYDVSEEKEHLLYSDSALNLKDLTPTSHEQQIQAQWAHSDIFKFGNRRWKLIAKPMLEFIHQHESQTWLNFGIPILGILISALTSFYFLALVNRRMLIEQEVQQRTNELANLNDILQREIHERQRIEEDFVAKQRYLEKRHEALEYLTKFTISEFGHPIDEVILRTATVMRVDRVGVWFYKTIDQIEILSCHGFYILSKNSFSNHLELTSTHFPNYFQALSKHSHLILPSTHHAELNQELASYLAVFHIHSKLDIPIIFEGKLLGVLSCEETRGHREWILEDRHFGQTIADIIAIIIEQSARRKAENDLQESEARLRFITQKSIDGIISINEKEEVISWNYGAQQMFGYTEMEMLGKSIRMVIPKDDFLLQKKITTKPIELKGRHKNEHLFPVEISQTRWENETISVDTIIIRDITERKEYEKRLIQAMSEAKAANAAKNEFLATISHELRTPLNAIIGFDQCLLMGMDGPINDRQYESLKKIEKSSFHLLHLIHDVLDWSKIEAKKMELEINSLNIVELIHSCIEEIKSLAHKKHLEVYLFIKESFILVEGDKVRIRQVLLNLLSNAIKFTEKGHVAVILLNAPHEITIQIKDTGIGLSQQEIEKIFNPFSQADSSITRKYGGTGLGLIISKNIINLHGGTITVKSEKGKGSTFTVTLPKVQ